MIHPSEQNPSFYRSQKEISSMFVPISKLQAEENVEVEKNYFGYIINIILSASWLLLFSSIFANQLIDFEQDILGICDHIDPIGLKFLALAALLLGSFHAYILHDNKEMNNKKTDSLFSNLTSAWLLVLGTLLYFIVVCFVYKNFATNNFIIRNFIIFILSLSIPFSFCGVFLFGDFSSSVFSPWTVKVKSQTAFETEEYASECRIVGFICFIGLAAFWFLSALFFGYFGIFDKEEDLCSEDLCFILAFICSFVHFGVLFYTLSTPKYDSGDSSNWIEFLKKNWLIIFSCSILSCNCVNYILGMAEYDDFHYTSIIASMLILLSICTVLLMIPSNSSRSCVRHFKPWNSKILINQIQVLMK